MTSLRYTFQALKSSELYEKIKDFERKNNFTDCSSNKDMTFKLKKFGITPKVERNGTVFYFNTEDFYNILKKNNENLFNENFAENV